MRARRTVPLAVVAALGLAAAGCGEDDDQETAAATPGGSSATTQAAPAAEPEAGAAQSGPRTMASRLTSPWGLAFLPGGDALVAERDTGRIKRVPAKGGRARTVMRVPGVRPGGEGGLLGIAVSPRYRTDRRVFAYFTGARDNRIVSFRLGSSSVRPVLTGLRRAGIHNGGRIAFGPDGKLYAGVGDAGDTSTSQDRSSRNGKVLRIDPDGSVPSDNPFAGSPVWSLGHRNVQGLAFDRAGRLWATEFGQNDSDEVNLIQRGRNYGWPEAEGAGTGGGRFVEPKVVWSPTSTSSPSGAAIKGRRLYVGALQGRTLWRIPLDGATAGRPTALYRGRYGRIRSVAVAPDGRVWFTTSNTDGRGDPASSDDRLLSISG